MDAWVYAVTSFGDTFPLLIAGGSFSTVDGTAMTQVACWNGTSWSSILGGISGTSVRALATVHLQGEPLLAVGGNFTSAFGGSSSNLALLRRLFLPQITQHPADQAVRAGQTATFTVTASGSGTLSYLWLRDGLPLSADTHFRDITTPTLTIDGVDSYHVGAYSCRVTNSGGNTTSNEAALTLIPSLAGDLNGDGAVNSLDLTVLNGHWGKNGADPGYDAGCDLNGDSQIDTVDLLMVADDWGK